MTARGLSQHRGGCEDSRETLEGSCMRVPVSNLTPPIFWLSQWAARPSRKTMQAVAGPCPTSPPPTTELALELYVTIAPAVVVGGERSRHAPVHSDHGWALQRRRRSQGEVMAGGADWQLRRPDGVTEVKAVLLHQDRTTAPSSRSRTSGSSSRTRDGTATCRHDAALSRARRRARLAQQDLVRRHDLACAAQAAPSSSARSRCSSLFAASGGQRGGD